MLLLIVISVARIPKDGYGGKKYILAGVLPIIIGGLADAALYYLDITDSYRNTYYSQLGVLIFWRSRGFISSKISFMRMKNGYGAIIIRKWHIPMV